MTQPLKAPEQMPDATQDLAPKPEPTPTALVDQGPNPVLITEQEVLFTTAAAQAVRGRDHIGRRLATWSQILATTIDTFAPRRPESTAHRFYYLEGARMAREMERL